jgi:hypothetical protein
MYHWWINAKSMTSHCIIKFGNRKAVEQYGPKTTLNSTWVGLRVYPVHPLPVHTTNGGPYLVPLLLASFNSFLLASLICAFSKTHPALCQPVWAQSHSLFHTHTHTHSFTQPNSFIHSQSHTHSHTHSHTAIHTHTHTHTHSHSQTHSYVVTHSHSLTHTHTHPHTHTHSFTQPLFTHSHTHSFTHTLIHSHSHTHLHNHSHSFTHTHTFIHTAKLIHT